MSSTTADRVGFDPTHFAKLARAEAGNFWFRARNQLILWSICQFAPTARTFLEIGCGTGFVLQAIASRFPNISLSGSELFEEGLPFAAERVPQARLRTLDAKNIDIENAVDAIGAFDVIEHIDDDVLVLRNLHKALTQDGHLFINVPQHQFLWSQSDDIACHYRRYERQDLLTKLAACGFEIELVTSFVALLLPMMIASRWWSNNVDRNKSVMSELETRGPLNFILEQILNVEIMLVRLGIRWPMGGSLYVVARKQRGSL